MKIALFGDSTQAGAFALNGGIYTGGLTLPGGSNGSASSFPSGYAV